MKKDNNFHIKILIVDDDTSIADIFKDLLSVEGRIVDVCYDGFSALDRLKDGSYDIIIVDLVMPEVDGFDILRFAKKVNPDVIVIIITGYASLETAMAAIKEGAYDYIRKPCKLEEIKLVVDNAVEKIRLNYENRKLIEELKSAYQELMRLKEEEGFKARTETINFFPSKMSGLHLLLNKKEEEGGFIERIEALSLLKDKGAITDDEFKRLKRHIIRSLEGN